MADSPVKKYSKAEFNTEEPYRLLLECRDDGWRYMQLLNTLEQNADEVGFRRFNGMLKAYLEQHSDNGRCISVVNNLTTFRGQPIELYSGDWIADDDGIMRRNERKGMDVACVHPILPIQRLVNIDDGTVRLKLAYRRDRRGWREVVANKSALYSAKEIKKLADKDVSVSDQNAAFLVQYLQDVEDLNHDDIPEKQSVSHLGWTSNGLFSPYMSNLEFDGIDNFRRIFESVHTMGDFDQWLAAAREVRKTDSPARIVLAASFASVLLKVIGKLNFIVHLWGGSEVGKTVALLLAVSVWGNPNEDGGYMQTFNGTAVGLELQAGFFNNMPLILDEFQLVKDKKSFEYCVYLLCEGIGKTRGSKTGGLQNTATWKNCSITSGETPITFSASGGGAVNRIVEIECREKLFEDPVGLLDIIRNNYGHAGKMFVTFLDNDSAKETAKNLYRNFYKEIGPSSTEKQTMAAAAILTADALATKWIFRDDRAVTAKEIEAYLHTKESVDIGLRAFGYLYDFCVSNISKFGTDADPCLGQMLPDELRIIKSSFEKICEDGGFNPKSLISWLDRKKILYKDGKGYPYKTVKINGKSVRCVCIDIREQEGIDKDGFESVDREAPFD